MVLVSFVLVVVAAITLVIGLLQSGLSIIYVSIACSLLAGIVLFTAVLRGRPEPKSAGAPAFSPAPQAAPPPPAPAREWSAPSSGSAPAQEPAPAPEAQPAMAGATAVAVDDRDDRDDRTETLDQVEIDEAVSADDDFPIHDYDSLRATEVLPMLNELTDDQLDAVRQREQDGKGRAMILNRIDSVKQSRASAWDADDPGWEPQPEPEPEPQRAASAPLFQAGRAEPTGTFPIPDYEELKALEVLGRLSDLNVSELQIVRERETQGLRRAMVLNRVDRLIEEAPPEPAPVVASGRGPGRAAKGTGRAAKAGAAKATGALKADRAAKTRAAAKVPSARKAAKKAPADAGAAIPLPASAPARKAAPAKRSPRIIKAAPAPVEKAAPAGRAAAAKKAGAAKRAVSVKRAAATKATTAKSAPRVRKATKKR